MLGEDFPVWLLGVPCAPDSNPSATLCNRAQSVHLFPRWNCTLVCLGTLLGGVVRCWLYLPREGILETHNEGNLVLASSNLLALTGQTVWIQAVNQEPTFRKTMSGPAHAFLQMPWNSDLGVPSSLYLLICSCFQSPCPAHHSVGLGILSAL